MWRGTSDNNTKVNKTACHCNFPCQQQQKKTNSRANILRRMIKLFRRSRRNQNENYQRDSQHTKLSRNNKKNCRNAKKRSHLHRLLTQEPLENPPQISHYPQKPRNTVGNSRIKLELFRAMNHIAQNVIWRRFPNVLRASSVSKNGSEATAPSQNPGF